MSSVIQPQPIRMSRANLVAMWTWLFSASTAMVHLIWQSHFGLTSLHEWRVAYLLLAFVLGYSGGGAIALRSKHHEAKLHRYVAPAWLFAVGAILAIGTMAASFSLAFD